MGNMGNTSLDPVCNHRQLIRPDPCHAMEPQQTMILGGLAHLFRDSLEIILLFDFFSVFSIGRGRFMVKK
jgi:hypothetical protein